MFFGWYVVAGTFVAQLFLVGFFTYSVSLLVSPVREEFGVSLEEVMYSLTAGTFVGMVLMPMAGAMIDRYPVRWIMAGGTLLFAAGLWGLARSTTITEYIVIFGLTMAAGNAFAGPAACSATISRWFIASRGRALGISAIGTSVGGIAIPALVTWWLARHDWRTTLDNLGLCIAFIVLPCVVLTIRGTPSDVGRLPEGGQAAADAAAASSPDLTLKDVLRHPGYWTIGSSIGVLFSVYTAILANLTPYATDLGATPAQASGLIMAVAVAGLVGKLAFRKNLFTPVRLKTWLLAVIVDSFLFSGHFRFNHVGVLSQHPAHGFHGFAQLV